MALLQLSLVDHEAAASFQNFCRFFRSFGPYPVYKVTYDKDPFNIDFRVLEELELITQSTSDKYQFSDFVLQFGNRVPSQSAFNLLHVSYYFTKKGAEIADAVFSPDGKPLSRYSDSEEDSFLKILMSESLKQYHLLLLEPKQYGRYFVVQSSPNVAEAIRSEIWQSVLDSTELSSRFKRLLCNYRDVATITVHDKPT